MDSGERQAVAARREALLRSALARRGYALQKDRARTRSLNKQGGYRIVDPNRNLIVWGERFDLTIDEVDAWLTES